MRDDQQFEASRMADLEQDVRHRINQQTFGRIGNLDVQMMIDRIVIRGRAESFYLKQLAIQGVLEAIQLWSNSPQLEINVQITVVEEKRNMA